MSERCLAVNHGQPGVLLTLFAVRSPGIVTIPKLTVRVRFPSPAPCSRSVAIHTNWAPSPIWSGVYWHQKSALVPLPRAINHAGGTVSSSAGSSPLGTLPLAAPNIRDASTRACLPTFPARAADQTHDAYMPDTARPVNGHPPGSSQGTPDSPWF